MSTPQVDAKSRHVSLNRIQRENSSLSTPSIRNTRPPPGPSPLSLKRSVSSGNVSPVDRSRKRRTRSSDVFQKRVSTLLEQAQSMYNDDDVSTSPHSEMDIESESPNTEIEGILFDGDLEWLEAELTLDLSSDGLQKMEIDKNVSKEVGSDDLFEFDDIEPEELEALFSSNDLAVPVQAQAAEEQLPVAGPVVDEDDMLFGDDNELMDFDFDGTQPEVFSLRSY
jgi:hypothetical protein